MNTATDRTHYRDLVAQVAAKAKAILPVSINGRLEGGVKLVLLGEVQPQADGTVQVGSCSDPAKVYHLVGATCDCKDFTDGKAPEGWCRHRISAGIDKRVRELLAAETPTGEPEAPAAPLPEAPASCNVYVVISGHKVQVTLRDTDEARMLARLQIVLDRYPPPAQPAPSQLSPQQHNAAAMHKKVTDFCPVHNVQMKLNHGKDGRSWHSHDARVAGVLPSRSRSDADPGVARRSGCVLYRASQPLFL